MADWTPPTAVAAERRAHASREEAASHVALRAGDMNAWAALAQADATLALVALIREGTTVVTYDGGRA